MSRAGAPSQVRRVRVFASNPVGFETEVTLPYFGANPRLFIIWMFRSHVFRDQARRCKPRQWPIRACSRRRTTARSALAPTLSASGPDQTPGSARQSANPQTLRPHFCRHDRSAGRPRRRKYRQCSCCLGKIWNLFSRARDAPASAKDIRQLDRMKPQKQAEALLELAVGNNEGAVDQISSRVDRWQGKVQWSLADRQPDDRRAEFQ